MTRESFLAAANVPCSTGELVKTETFGEITVRPMPLLARLRASDLAGNSPAFSALVLAGCVMDDKDKPMFASEADASSFLSKAPGGQVSDDLMTLLKAGVRLSRLSADDNAPNA